MSSSSQADKKEERDHGEQNFFPQDQSRPGGFTGDAYTGSIRVKRKAGDRYKIATVNEEQFQTFVLQDGDSLMLDSVIPY